MTTQRLFEPLQESAQVIGRRGMISTVAPIMALMVTEQFTNLPPEMNLLTTEAFVNTPPDVTLLTMEPFENAPTGSLLVADNFGGYFFNPNVQLDARIGGLTGRHIDVEITVEQDDGAGVWSEVKSSPFGTILDVAYPERDFRATVPPTYSEWSEAEQKTIIYDADTVTLTYNGSYSVLLDFIFSYHRRAGQ